ncbi:hypothetical protein [Mesorhizobium sp.]|uniref:hypothetical protein n=1 Tax=Mesorhizobium sp. TaxID=1871066 RepID=UPI000FE72C4F|nr:hypothetical protein [Mesorhizobium sp.]RWM84292.1 MAG: hypothetical protein EOR83_16855 [Mesorhizobium sp.]
MTPRPSTPAILPYTAPLVVAPLLHQQHQQQAEPTKTTSRDDKKIGGVAVIIGLGLILTLFMICMVIL